MKILEQKELCEWLRNNSSGVYRPAAQAADEIERLQRAYDCAHKQAMENGAAAQLFKAQLNEQLNDCINFDGGKLTDSIMEVSSKLLKAD